MNTVRSLFRNAGYLDVETLGLGTDSPIHQIGFLNRQTGAGLEYIPDPYSLIKGNGTDPFRLKLEGSLGARSWPQVVQQKLTTGSWLEEKLNTRIGPNLEPLYPHLIGHAIPTSRIAKVGSEVAMTSIVKNLNVGEAYKNVIGEAAKVSGPLWIANAVFEARLLGGIGEAYGTTEALRSKFTYAPKEANQLLYVNDPSVLRAKSRALATGDWRGVWEAIENLDLSKPGLKVLDIQDVIRSAQSYGKQVSTAFGLGIDIANASTTVGLDIHSHILGLGKEYHRAVEDNLLSAIVGETSAEHIQTYRSLLDRAHMATSGLTLNAREANALNWLWKVNEVKKGVSESHLQWSSIARAMHDLEFGNESGNKVTYYNVGYQSRGIKQLYQGREITTHIPVPNRRPFYSMDTFLDYLSGTQRGRGHNLTALVSDIRAKASIGGVLNQSKLQSLIEREASRETSQVLGRLGEGRFSAGHIIGNIVEPVTQATHKRSRLGLILGGIGLGLVALGAVHGAISGSDDAYNTVEGMNENGYAAYLRQQNTDFGSPYQGLWDSVSLAILNAGYSQTPTYVNNIPIDQQIADFRDKMMQTPLQKQIIEKQLQKQQLQSMDRLYFLNPSLTTPVSSSDLNPAQLALSKRGDLQVVDITNMNWAVEDADTIILKQGVKGLMGKEMQVRLTGIDAPEIQHSEEAIDMLRYRQAQPHGEESKAALQSILSGASRIQVILDPTGDTYGRSLGVLVADNKNVNLELVKTGQAAALPFGQETSDIIDRNIVTNAERMAYRNKQGMWTNDFWRTYRRSVPEQNRITFNTLSRLDKLAGNMNIAALDSVMNLSEQEGYGTLVQQSIPYLQRKLSGLGKKKEYHDNFIPTHYQSQQPHLDQLKIETARHMSIHGNLISDHRLRTGGHQLETLSFPVDSLERSSSIYQNRLPAIIDKYDKKNARKKVQAITHRQALRDSYGDQNVVRM